MATIDFHSNADEIINMKNGAVERALEAIGIQAEGYAKLNLYPGHGLDTGRLRSSITHMQENDDTEIIATPVEYAPYVEYGTRRHPTPIEFMRPAVQEHTNEYKRIAEEYLKDA